MSKFKVGQQIWLIDNPVSLALIQLTVQVAYRELGVYTVVEGGYLIGENDMFSSREEGEAHIATIAFKEHFED